MILYLRKSHTILSFSPSVVIGAVVMDIVVVVAVVVIAVVVVALSNNEK